jgi:signal transduction histidine kinase
MWHTFPIAFNDTSAVANPVGVIPCQPVSGLLDLVRTGRFLLLIALLFAMGCRARQANMNPSIEFTQVPRAGAGGPERTKYIGDTATAANRAPGACRFSIMASNLEGASNGPETSVSFVVEQAFWQTLWFRIISIGACLLIAAFLYQLRIFRLTRQLNVRFQERLAERTRIAQELHDTLLQSFQGLMLRFQTATDTVLTDPQDAKDCLERALDRADQALAESRQAIQGIRSVPLAEHDLPGVLNAMMTGLAQDRSYAKQPIPITSVLAEGQARTVNPWIVEDVCKIAREALWNAFSHSRALHIEVEVAYSKRSLRLRFRDDGIGIDPAIVEAGGRAGHWGISGMNERAKNVHGRLGIWSMPNAGTEVELTMPAYVAFEATTPHRWFRRSERKENARG